MRRISTDDYDELWDLYEDNDRKFLKDVMYGSCPVAECIYEGDEEIDGKMLSKEYVFKMNSDGKTYAFYHTTENSGYWSDSSYDDFSDIEEVELKEIVVKKWMPVK